jgi:ubiquinone/menaquinone biosynthesis C-methylase UbiE
MDSREYARMHALETDYWWFSGRRAIIASLLGTLPCRASCHLLDIGCGTGANLPMLRRFAGKDGRVTAVDFSPLALQFARDHLSDEKDAARLSMLQGDALHLPFEDASFDVVTMLDVLEHLCDDGRALSEVHRVLKPGGALVLSVPAYQKLWSAHDEALHHFRRYEYWTLKKVLQDGGFEIPLQSFAMSLMPPIAWLWRKLILPFQPKRPKDAKRHSEGAVLPSVPPFFNRMLVCYLAIEGKIITRRRVRFGTSLVAVARKVSAK